ncbi:MAG TPA: 7-cyano-7-deazaguanine synthase, partial [Nitrospira sp.]|nr:7-cyano-7-deazaguanine synthase [Nitrospira sp.]
MSGIYSVLIANDDGGWVAPLEKSIGEMRSRGMDGTRTAVSDGSKWSFPKDGRVFRTHHDDGKRYSEYRGLIGCAYSQPVALDAADAGPFLAQDGSLALAYDGVVAGYTGAQLVERLHTPNGMHRWCELVQQLDGQFALIAIDSELPNRIYYAVKAKPLSVLYDSLGRGIVAASDAESLRGMYHATRSPRPLILKPYTSGFVTSEGIVTTLCSLVRFYGEGSLVLSGGGIDTLVAAYDIKKRYPAERMHLAYFDYGAKSREQELAATESIGASLSIRYSNAQTTWRCYDFPLLGQIAASSLTDARSVVNVNPQAGKPSEWVPARNTVLMTLALAMAESYGFARVVTGINQDAATAYPDNDEEWNRRMQFIVPYALGPDRYVSLEAPLSSLSK